jgi:hypothetical protein
MTKLRHQLKPYLVALRMTRFDTIIYIEGTDNDPIFYEAIAQRYSDETGRSTQLRLADELPNAAAPNMGGAGGKRTLVRAAEFLERWRGARPARLLQGKEIAFCVDKDADDVLGTLAGCPAILHTSMHSAENHIVLGSNLHRAICYAISVTAQSVNDEIKDCDRLRLLSHQWREWVVYCLLSLRLNIKKSGNYGQESPFNTPPHAPANLATARLKFDQAKKACGVPEAQFDIELNAVTELVDRLIRDDRFDEVFKGKWYVSIFFSLLENTRNLGSRCRACGKNGLWIGIRSAFALDEGTYRRYANALARLK